MDGKLNKIIIAISIIVISVGLTLRGQISGLIALNSGSSTPQPPAGMSLWYSADCITYVSSVCGTPSNGTNITAWADRSGNANNMAETTGTSTFNTSQINGQPAVTNTAARWSYTPITLGGQITTFWVTKYAGSTLLLLAGNVTGSYQYYWTGGLQHIGFTCLADDFAQGSTTLTNGWHQSNVVNSFGGTSRFRLDRANDGSTFTGVNFVNPLTYYGGFASGCGSANFTFQAAEVIAYLSALNSTDITTVETYLNTKYGL